MADSVQSTAELKKPVAPASPVTEKRMPIVGIGASAGGLEAFQQVLQALPDNTGMAFVVVQHLAPSHASLLATILQRSSKMPVVEVHDEPEVEANKVYVIPPNRDMTLADGRLKLLPRTEGRGQHRPIDTFLRSLAEHANHQAIGVVLSGTGNDGTLGLMAIKAEGGITFAQDQSAQQEGMPQSAIASGSVDFIYSPEQIAAELVRISKHPYIAPSPDGAPETPAASQADNSIEKIIKLLHESTGVDFTNYRSTTLYRRITRRMLLQNLDSVKEYLHFLTDNAAELQNLYCDILISVTSFFRDPQVFESLKHKIFPKLLKDRSAQNPLRLWIVGCSTGEEAYSMAIALAESMTDLKVQSPVQIFATDLNDVGIEKARAGIYPKTIAQEISSDRLRRFFTETGGGYQINKSIRDMCVFARQNVLADPPFSRMDLITCRNLLIYLEPVLQRKIIPLFHYALKPQGVLWLGSSESIGNFADLFEVIDSKHKLYQKKPGATPVHVTVSLTPQRWGGQSFHAPHPRYGEGHLALDLQREADRLALAKYSPPAVLVNSDFDILQFRGDTSPYLAAAPGKPSVNVMKMAREGLLVGLRSTLQRAVKEGVPARQEGLLVKSNGGFREVNLEIVPVRSLDAEAGCYLIMFEPVGTISHLPATAIKDLPSSHLSQDDANRHINHLTQELATTREYLQSLIEQQEAANEELQAANEEVQSSNEELQSTNEELQTSKEEIQSSNEELTTVNEELSRRNEQLWQANSDLTNFLNSTELAIVMLDRQLHIHRFNGHAEKLFDLTAADVGKPIAKLRLPFDGSHLLSELSTVIESMRAKEFEVQDKEGHWYSLRLRPYRSHDHQVDGVLLVLVNIDTQKRTQFSLQQSENRLSLAIEGAGMGTWDTDLRSGESVWSASRFRNFGLPPAPGGRARLEMWFSQIHPDDLEHVKADMERAKREKSLFATEHRIIRADNQQVVWLQPFGRFYYDDAGQAVRFSGVSFDNTPRKLAEQALQQADRNKDRFLAMLAHELRNPLAPLRNALDLLRRGARGTASPNLAKTTLADKTGEAVALVDRAAGIMDRQADKLTRLVDDLLDITRINQGKIALHRELVDLRDIVPAAAESVEHQILAQGLKLNLALPTKPVYVAGDAVRLEQVLANLLINAAKYTERQGSIDVDLRATPLSPPSQGDTGGVAILRVSDTGIGIKPEQLPTIFELFTQGEDNGGRDQGGLGIGLSLVRQLVQLHGGTVEAFSAGVGKGSVFIIRLPLLSGAQIEQAKKRPSREETSPPALPPQRILVVDDNVDAADSLADLLKIFGHDVRVTYTGHSALEEAREFAPQVVLLDIGLPGMDGNEVCRRMLQRPETKQAIMVALTGYGNDDAYYRTKEAGFHSHLLKPVNAQDLLQILAKLAMRAGKKKS